MYALQAALAQTMKTKVGMWNVKQFTGDGVKFEVGPKLKLD